MKELVKVKIEVIGDEYVRAVSGRDLYDSLGLNKTHWKRWYEKNIVNNKNVSENVHWVGFAMMANGNETRDFAITLDFAKHISMMADTDAGRTARDYFVACEKELKELNEQFNQKQMYRQIAREEAYPMLLAFDECAEETGRKVSNYDHSTEFDMLNSIVLGTTAQGYKYANNIPLHESSIRDYLSPTQLEAVAFLQNANTLMLEEGEYDRDLRRARLQRLCDKKFKIQLERDLLRLQS